MQERKSQNYKSASYFNAMDSTIDLSIKNVCNITYGLFLNLKCCCQTILSFICHKHNIYLI